MIKYELRRGLAYRSIKHPSFAYYSLWLPLAVTAIMVASYLALPVKPSLLGKDGLLLSTLSVLSTLPGFYFAGLAAVATFGSTEMDKEMPHPAPTIEILVSGNYVVTKLTRRLFLTYLFSYLVVVSFALCIAIIALHAATPSLASLFVAVSTSTYGEWVWLVLKVVGVGFISWLASTLTVTTLHGVFFLAEKIHQPTN